VVLIQKMSAPLSVIFFSLDFTLWECGGQRFDYVKPPFTADLKGRIHDTEGRLLRLYPDVPKIFEEIDQMGYRTGITAQIYQFNLARVLLEMMNFRDRFDFEEIYPGKITVHFKYLNQITGIPFEEMLFFDYEAENIAEVEALGVKSMKVKRGITLKIFEKALDLF